ncbi:MAG: hypothetical protein ACQETD_08930 [Pseudomonadota bacterium]
MAKEKGQIGLDIAERQKPTKDNFDYRSGSVGKWVKELPMGNIGEMARHVYDALREVNRLAIPWKERFAFLELMREPISYVQSALVKRYTGMAFPLPDKTQRIATLARTLYSEMALGYKTAIEEMLASSFLVRDNKMLRVMIHRAIRYLSQATLNAYQTYSPHPEHSWFELHALFLYAEHKGFHQDPVKDPYNSQMPESSIARAYKQILLLALASPYRLRQGEAEAVYAALARWAGHAHIVPYNAPEASEALFVVHMDSDAAPDYQAFSHRDCNTELCRLVDTRQLSQILADELEALRKNPDRGAIQTELLERLIQTWGVAPKRHYSRSDSHSNIEVVVGTAMLHRALAHELGDPSLRGKSAHFEGRDVVSYTQPTEEDPWDVLTVHEDEDEQSEASTEEQATQAEMPPAPEVHVWQVSNESAGGYRLALDSSQQAKVQVGELLGLRSPKEGATWEVGVVRWMRQGSDSSLEVGVQALAPHARPVMVRNKQAGGNAGGLQYALLLPEISAIKQPATLLTPVMLFNPGDKLNVYHSGKEKQITLDKQVQNSGSFVQFLLKRDGAQPKEVVPQTDSASMDSVFDDI